jgi:hypothetical protein
MEVITVLPVGMADVPADHAMIKRRNQLDIIAILVTDESLRYVSIVPA